MVLLLLGLVEVVHEGAGRTVRAADVRVEDGVRLAGTGGAGDGEDAGVRLASRRVLAVVRLPRRLCKKTQVGSERDQYYTECKKTMVQ